MPLRMRARYKGFTFHPAGAAAQVGPILRRVHSSLTRNIANQARLRVPVRTGELGRAIGEDAQTMVGPFKVTGGVHANTPYAAAVHEGSRPHIIRARNGGFLHFKMGGRDVFVRSVNHPGARARPFLRNAGTYVVATDPRIH